MFGGGLGHRAANQIVSDEAGCRALCRPSAGCGHASFHLEGRFEIIQAHFQSPAPQVGLEDFLCWIELGVQEVVTTVSRRTRKPF